MERSLLRRHFNVTYVHRRFVQVRGRTVRTRNRKKEECTEKRRNVRKNENRYALKYGFTADVYRKSYSRQCLTDFHRYDNRR